jgi:hypothetical protein
MRKNACLVRNQEINKSIKRAMGKWDYRKGRVARRQDVCQKIGNSEDCPSRFAKLVRRFCHAVVSVELRIAKH